MQQQQTEHDWVGFHRYAK